LTLLRVLLVKVCLQHLSPQSSIIQFMRILNTITLSALLALGLGACATRSEISQYYKPGFSLEQVPQNPSTVRVLDAPSSPKDARNLVLSLSDQGYFYIGSAVFSGPPQTPEEIRKFAASVGGDCVIFEKVFMGTGTGSRMVVGSYTPPSVGYSSTFGSAFGTGTGSANSSTPFGAVNTSIYGQSSAIASARSTTYNPGQTTYMRQDYNYPVFNQCLMVFQSPKAQAKNWKNIQALMDLPATGLQLDQYASVSDQEIKNMPEPHRQLVLAMRKGQQFTPITAQQFIFFRSHRQIQGKQIFEPIFTGN
jgi:hypothetical protein